ncbi:terminase family protein [Nocardiopsis sp. CT-R113]|uniref:Terminase family protein n=1 Tax=Nocardiopsis codii TaxID=3065942 RepID=A0ABU7KGC5_9ACTN|nr:terminase family protein [Nocardiopsis sp. CT-R113]MEE2041265.1 terminase family protein [Nocardiopsis sp. CT-R113]
MSPIQLQSITGALSTPQIAVWSGAVASGKTIASLLAFLILITRAPRTGLIVVCGRTLQTIERNLLDVLQSPELFGPIAAHVHHTTGSTTAVILGRTVHLVGASDARAEGRIRGATIALAYVDEATLIPESFWTMLLSRLRVRDARLLATTNPDGPRHWLRRDYLLRGAEIGLRHWHLTLDDNPGLPEGFAERLKRQYVGLWHRRFVLGEWCLAEGAVYEMFDDDRHVVDALPPIDRWLAAGVDYGTVNPFAGLLIGVGADRRLYVTAEYRHDSRHARRQMTDAEYSAELRKWLAHVPRPHEITGPDRAPARGVRPERIYVDPSAASFMTQLWSDKVSSVTAADNTVLDGIRAVSSLLGQDRLRVHRSCTGLLAELPGYSWDPAWTERGEDRPIKVDDHSVDALRYALYSSAWQWRAVLRLPILDLAA